MSGFSENLGGGEDNMWAMKVPAKNGAITFAAGTDAVSATIAFAKGKTCVTSQAWSASPVDLAIKPQSLKVTAEAVKVTTYSLAP